MAVSLACVALVAGPCVQPIPTACRPSEAVNDFETLRVN